MTNGVLPGTTALIIPTLNAGRYMARLIPAIKALRPGPDWVWIIDSSSDDDTLAQVESAGFTHRRIARESFDHGGTRNLGASLASEAEFLVFLTQDALPVDEGLLQQLLEPFEDPQVALVYARQLPYGDACVAARFSRYHRYPDTSFRRVLADAREMGAMAAFCSNSCAAYRRSAFDAVGKFPVGYPLGEDMSIAARFLVAGFATVYRAEAQVFHSHDYNWMQEFSRYYDIGIHHRMDAWLCREGLQVGGQGAAYLFEEIRYTWRTGTLADLFPILPRLGARWLGHRIGHQLGASLPAWLQRRLSLHGYVTCKDRAGHCHQ